MLKKCFALLCITAALFAAAAHNCFAESAYTLDPAKDLVIGAASLGLAASALFIGRSGGGASKGNVHPDDFPLSKDSVNAFDRGLMYEYSKPLDTAGYVAVYTLAAAPLITLFVVQPTHTWAVYSVMYAESALLVFGSSELLKNVTSRYRPYCYFDDVPAGMSAEYHKSFPSMHTAFAFMSAGFLTTTFAAEYPDSPWKIPLSAASYSLAAGIGLSRVFSGSHFISDVLAGAALGSLFGYLVPRLHLRGNRNAAAFIPLHNGFAFEYRF